MRIAIAFMLVALALAGCASNDGTDDTTKPGVPAIQTPEEGPMWAAADNATIRPGSPIGWCTYNFLFYSPLNDTYYIGTAAHCTDALGQRMPVSGIGEIGTVVYDSDNTTDSEGVDFSLIQLDEGMNLNAYPGVWNRVGPVGSIEEGDVAVGDVIEHHGYGLVFGNSEATRDRDGVITEMGKDYCSESPIWWGDSGSPVLHQDSGKALGIVSRAGWFGCMPTSQLMGATMPYIFEELEKAGWSIELATTE